MTPSFRPALLASAYLLTATMSHAQCLHDPVVIPDSLVLCPGDTFTLSTMAADAYQWFRNMDPIPGATNQTLVVYGNVDAGSFFKVHVTLDSCTESSPTLAIDGYAFTQPQVYYSGDVLSVDSTELTICANDTLLLLAQPPYNTGFQWYQDSVLISGEDNDTLVVTSAGSFALSAQQDGCPNVQSAMSYPWVVVLEPVLQPTISTVGTDLCAAPPGNAYQWAINGIPVLNGTTECIPASFLGGSYTVLVDYGSPCQLESEPFVVQSVQDLAAGGLSIHPNPASTDLWLSRADGRPIGAWRLLDALGRQVLAGAGLTSTHHVDVAGFAPGHYALITDHRAVVPVLIRCP